MKVIHAALSVLLALASPVSAQTTADQASASAQPRSVPAKVPSGAPTISVRGFGLITEQEFAALTTFKAIFGSSSGSFFGGGAQVVHRSGVYIEFSASQFRKTGERAFRSNGLSFQLGIPLTATVTPIEVSGGYRIRLGQSRRIVPYVGAGGGSYGYREISEGSDGLDTRHGGVLVVAGVEVRAHWIAFAVDAQHTRIPGILGKGGISQEANEEDLGGTAVRARVIVGR
jgi:hypothetical protein